MPSKIITLFILCYLLQGCSNSSDEKSGEDPVIAEAFGEVLHFSDLDKVVHGLSGEDSVFSASEFINSWMRKQMLVSLAKEKLSPAQLDKTELLDQYYNDLILFEFQNAIVSNNLDTFVADTLLLQYYNTNNKNFQLKENIVKLIFFKIPTNYEGLNKAFKAFKKGDEEILSELAIFCAQNGGNFLVDPNSWLSFNDILKEIPINTYNQEHYLNNNKWIRIDSESFTYFVHILNFKFKNSLSPFEFEKDRIKNIILNKRKSQLLEQKEQELLSDAISNKKVIIY